MEQRDVAPIAKTSTSSSILPVGLHDAFTGESESVSAETAGPATTHPELSPAGDHPSEGWAWNIEVSRLSPSGGFHPGIPQ